MTNQSIPIVKKLIIYPLNEQSVTVIFGDEIDLRLLSNILDFNECLRTSPFPGFITTTIAYGTLTVQYNIEHVANSNLPGISCFDKVCRHLHSLKNLNTFQKNEKLNTIRVPVCYGGKYGPDLIDLAEQKNMDLTEFIEIHSSNTYTVFMIGFVPGFAYLGGMNPVLTAPRKQHPRAKVPAGSVGIAGLQTGIYPLTTPGGWQLIGQTPLRIFNPSSKQPSMFQAGDLIKFHPINVQEFEHLLNCQDAD